jgi:hypothetical protein
MNRYHTMQRSTLIIIDRTEDFIAPLLHDFGYQAMLADMLEIDGNRLKFPEKPVSTAEKEASVAVATTPGTPAGKKNDDDLILKASEEPFHSTRHTHVSEATEIIEIGFKMLRDSEAGKLDSDSARDAKLDTIAAALSQINDYKKAKEVS